jgi:hypothetical protein
MRDTVVTLPLRIHSPLNGSHGHWAHKANRRKNERQTTGLCCSVPLNVYREGLAKGYLASIRVTIVRIAPRQLDDDNLRAGAKSVRDGITDALGLKDDRDSRLAWDYGQERGKSNEYAVRIVVSGVANVRE